MDTVIQIEIVLNYLNDLFAKSVAFRDKTAVDKLRSLRHRVYYESFDYDDLLTELKEVDRLLKKYV